MKKKLLVTAILFMTSNIVLTVNADAMSDCATPCNNKYRGQPNNQLACRAICYAQTHGHLGYPQASCGDSREDQNPDRIACIQACIPGSIDCLNGCFDKYPCVTKHTPSHQRHIMVIN